MVEYCRGLVRARDRGRYLGGLLLPRAARPLHWGLHALDAELAAVAALPPSEARAARLAWWRAELRALG